MAAIRLACASALLLAVTGFAQDKPPEAPAIPMPPDRAEASYAIYSSLLPLGETARWVNELFLVRDVTTTVVPVGESCDPEPQAGSNPNFNIDLNPHRAVHPPPSNAQDFKEILEDFDAHCHDHLTLSATGWKTSAPVLLLTPSEQKEFQKTGPRKAFKGASTLNAFSEVYFNAQRTVALVYASHWCGLLCGQGLWIPFAFEDGQWKPLWWESTSWIS